MGLQSALTTSLTGLQAAETVIDVVGNNVANSGTVGFKESDVLFANQFLQTQSIGSAPTVSTGGTNPRQIGLGVKVASINPDFTQGTIQISSNPLDVAIQGDGFLIVEGFQGEQLFSRNGQLQTNSLNEIVTPTGNRVLGLPVDENFQIDTASDLQPLTIPLGSQTVAQATQTAHFTGVLSPQFEVATRPGILTSEPLGDATIEFPDDDALGGDFDASDIQISSAPNTNTSSGAHGGVGTLAAGNYQYRVTWFTNNPTIPPGMPDESAPSAAISVNGVLLNEEVNLSNLPVDLSPSPYWSGRRVYRSTDGGVTFNQIGPDLDLTTNTFNDNGSLAVGGALNDDSLNQQEYSYYVTFFDSSTGTESRPTSLIGPFPISDGSSRIRIDNIPQPSGGGFSEIRLYRNVGSSATAFHMLDVLPVGTTTYIDAKADADIQSNPTIDLLGARAGNTTRLVDVVVRVGAEYTTPFEVGTLTFTGSKGGRSLSGKEFRIDANTTLLELKNFMQQSYGIDVDQSPGGVVTADGELEFTSNLGIENEVGVGLSPFRMTPDATGVTTPIPITFGSSQNANGKGSTTNFVVYDTLGEPVNVRITTVMEAQDGTSTTYRWFATSEDNEPLSGVSTFLRSGQLVFDRNGNITNPPDGRAAISIDHPAESPLEFQLDFSQISGLARTDSGGNPTSYINMTSQDGFPPGSLTSFTITESGLIRGVFSNGAERPLGQIRMARFANSVGLAQVGNNMFSEGINSGEPIIGNPGEAGLGTLTAGAVELSNSDIGQNLIELILASSQYRGGARVITTTQQLLDELLNIRR